MMMSVDRSLLASFPTNLQILKFKLTFLRYNRSLLNCISRSHHHQSTPARCHSNVLAVLEGISILSKRGQQQFLVESTRLLNTESWQQQCTISASFPPHYQFHYGPSPHDLAAFTNPYRISFQQYVSNPYHLEFQSPVDHYKIFEDE